MNTPAFSVARTTRTATEADQLIAAMRSEGFHPLDLETAGHFSLAGADVSFHIQVPTVELALAEAFLKTYDASTQDKPSESSIFRAMILPSAVCIFGMTMPLLFGYLALRHGFPVDRTRLIRMFVIAVCVAPSVAWLYSYGWPIALSPSGVQAYSFWGATRFVRWADIQDTRVFWFLNLKYVRIRSRIDGRITWICLTLREADHFHDLILQYTGSGCQILRFV